MTTPTPFPAPGETHNWPEKLHQAIETRDLIIKQLAEGRATKADLEAVEEILEQGRLSVASLKSTIDIRTEQQTQALVPPMVDDRLAQQPDVVDAAAQRAVSVAADPAVAALVTSPSETGQALAATFPPVTATTGDHLVLDIPTYDGNPNTTHPDILFMPEGFGPQGHRYWMSHTPYPADQRENPSVVSSPDGVTWTVPPGAPDPVVPYSEISADYYYNSDSILFMLADGQTMAMYYRPAMPGDHVAIMRKTTLDGVNWSAGELILTLPHEDGRMGLLSPCLVREDDGSITMYVANPTPAGQDLQRWRSTDDGASFTYLDDATVPTLATRVWHFDVKRAGGRYWMLLNRRREWDLQLLSSSDGKTFQYLQTIPKTGTPWDEWGHYRSAMLIRPGNPYTLDIYVGGIDASQPDYPAPTPGEPVTGNPPPEARWRILLMANIPVAGTGGGYDETVTAVGYGARGDGQNPRTTAIGALSSATAPVSPGAVAIGYGVAAVDGAVAIGHGINATGARSVLIGDQAAGGALAVAIGEKADANASNAVAIGRSSKSLARATSVGVEAESTSDVTAAYGYQAKASVVFAVALGPRAVAAHQNSVAIGERTATTATNQVAVGARDVEIQDAARGVILRSPNGTRYRLTVADDGTLGTTAV